MRKPDNLLYYGRPRISPKTSFIIITILSDLIV